MINEQFILKQTPSSKMVRFPAADGIRGLAVLIVLCTHAAVLFFPRSGPYLSGTGKIGVWLFFVLSAFLLTSKMMSTGFSLRAISDYIVGRFFRIIPIFIIAVAIYMSFGFYGPEDALKIATLRQGFAHLWTIPVEFKFYFILPFLAFLAVRISDSAGVAMMTLFFIALIIFIELISPYYSVPENSVNMFPYLPSFITGLVAAICLRKGCDNFLNRYSFALCLFILTIMVLSSPGMRHWLLSSPMTKDLQHQFIPLSVLWSFFVCAIISGKGIMGRLMQNRLLSILGRWSFSIYLMHWMIYIKISDVHNDSFIYAILAFALAIFCGYIFYYFIEVNIERFRHRFVAKIFKSNPSPM